MSWQKYGFYQKKESKIQTYSKITNFYKIITKHLLKFKTHKPYQACKHQDMIPTPEGVLQDPGEFAFPIWDTAFIGIEGINHILQRI